MREITYRQALNEALGKPERIVPIAYLFLGHVTHNEATPELETKGCRKRLPLEDLVFRDRWEGEE